MRPLQKHDPVIIISAYFRNNQSTLRGNELSEPLSPHCRALYGGRNPKMLLWIFEEENGRII